MSKSSEKSTGSTSELDRLRDMVNQAATATQSLGKVETVVAEEKAVASEEETAPAKVVDLRDNPFHQIFINPEYNTPEKVKAALDALLQSDATKDEKANQKLMADLTAYMETIQKTLEGLGLKQVEQSSFHTVVLLQGATDSILTQLADLKLALQPFTNVIETLRTLKEANAQLDLIEGVRQEKKLDDERSAKRAERDQRLSDLEQSLKESIKEKGITIDSVGGVEKFISGFVKTGYTTKVATLEAEITQAQDEISEINEEIKKELQDIEAAEAAALKDPLYSSKRAVRGLLDIGDEKIKKAHDEIKLKATNFIKDSSKKVSEVIDELEIVKGRIQKRAEINGKAASVVTILNESVKDAMIFHSDRLDEVQKELAASDGKSQTELLISKRSQTRLERYVGELKNNHTMTVTSLGEIQENEAAIANMARNNTEIISRATQMRSRTIASTAMRTAITLDTVATDAGLEALNVVDTALADMDDFTGKILKQAMGQAVLNEQDANARMLAMIDRMADLTTTVNTTSEGLGKQTKIAFALLDQFGVKAEDLKREVETLKGVDASSYRAFASDREKVLDEGLKGAEELLGRSENKKAFDKASSANGSGGGSGGGAPANDVFGNVQFMPVRAPQVA